MKQYIKPHTYISACKSDVALMVGSLPATPDTPQNTTRYHNKLWEEDEEWQ